ncbi:chorismate synthase [bacterium]|nr:chorismate synthase [bacterium]
MKSLKILTAGESHGQGLTGIISGIPAGIKLDLYKINLDLARRQQGTGRGGRMKIEKDSAEIISGVRFGTTLGSPIAVLIKNRDWDNWKEDMAVWGNSTGKSVTIPRPGHADLAGSVKYNHKDLRNVLERASARETAVRVALGSIAKQLIEYFGIKIVSHVTSIGNVKSGGSFISLCTDDREKTNEEIIEIFERAEKSPVRCASSEKSEEMTDFINRTKELKDTAGGIFEIAALNVPAGLGSYSTWDERLDSLLSAAISSIPGIKGVEIGAGFNAAELPGSQCHDPILIRENRIERSSNNAGGIEGGVSNGQPVIIRAAMKPIPTLTSPIDSVDLETMKPAPAHRERSDICAVPAASIVGEAMTALAIADVFLRRFGGDSIELMDRSFKSTNKI